MVISLDVPHMGAAKLAPWLTEYAKNVPDSQAIVEVGAWLGAGTRYLVRENGPLWVFDHFRATASEVEKASKFGVELKKGQDTLPWVKAHLPKNGIRFMKGDIRTAVYKGPPIGLYVDDASKSEKLWRHSMQTFEPHFVSGAILMLQDYWFPPCGVQREYASKWEMIVENIPGTSCAVFRA